MKDARERVLRLDSQLLLAGERLAKYRAAGSARAVVAQRAGDSLDELEAYLRATYRMDPVGVTAVRNVMRGRS